MVERPKEYPYGPVGRIADGPGLPVDCFVCGERVSNLVAESGPALESHYAAVHPDVRPVPDADSATRPDVPWALFGMRP